MPIDRRVVRTSAMLHQALLSLILDKGYEAITIKDICNAANVGRTTFYAHYTDKDDLKRSGLDHLRTALLVRHKNASDPPDDGDKRDLGFSLTMFEHAHNHIDLYRALVGGRGGTVALETIRGILSDLVRLELAAAGGNGEDVPRELC